jgi:hypothetical protein
MKKICIAMTAAMFVAGCSSTGSKTSSEPQPEKVVGRMDDLSSRPSWLKEGEPFTIESGHVMALGSATIPADDRIEAAYRIAENNAKASVANAVEQRLEYILQNAEEGTGTGTTQARYIGAETSKLTTSSLRLDKRYWEKVAVSTADGQRVVQTRVFVAVRMPEADFKQAVFQAIRRQQGQGGISQDFKSKVEQHWDRFVGPQGPAPASESEH